MENRDIRQREPDLHVITMHIYSLFILLSGLILSRRFTSENIYMITNFNNLYLFAFIGLCSLLIILFYNKAVTTKEKYGTKVQWIKYAYITFPLIVSITALVTIKDGVLYTEMILVIPVLVAASIMGRNAGLFTSIVCIIVLIIYLIYTEGFVLRLIIDSNIIFISILLLIGWYVGVLADKEKRYKKELEEKINSLKEEIVKRKKVEYEVARLEQLYLVGEMAASLGHEIRNPLATVRGFIQILGEKKECSRHKEYYDLMIEELDRVNSIIKEFLSMAKDKTVDKKLHCLNQIILTVLPLIESDAKRNNCSIITELEDNKQIQADEKEMRQVIFNLVRNGFEAMPSGGILTIRTYRDDKEKMVVLAIQDQGKGIEPGILEKIGKPFFTTKESGTGLGLAICYSIAARHYAKIEVLSGPTGTTFLMKFPDEYQEYEFNVHY